jgi:hypothetical protein
LSSRTSERREVGKAEPPGERRLLALDARDLIQADLMDLVGRQIGRGHLLDPRGVARCTVGQRPHSDLGPPVRHVVVAQERREHPVCRLDLIAHRGQDRSADPVPVGCRDLGRELVERLCKRAVLGGLAGEGLGLPDALFEQDARRNEVLLEAAFHERDHLFEHVRQRAEPDGVVVVVLDRRERELGHALSQPDVLPRDLVDWHQPVLESCPVELLLQSAHHELLVQHFLIREPRGVDRLEPGQELPGRRQLGGDRLERVVPPAIIVSAIAQPAGEHGRRAQHVLPLLVEQCGQLPAALVERRRARRQRRRASNRLRSA